MVSFEFFTMRSPGGTFPDDKLAEDGQLTMTSITIMHHVSENT